MSTTYITIDCGTSNTRFSIIKNGKIIDVLKVGVGAGASKDDPNILKETISNGITDILGKNNLVESDIECIIACGMITSELGLCNLEHIKAPCGIEELALGLHNTVLSEITSIPFNFVRGVKMIGNTFENTDVMRGEETEILGLFDKIEPNCLYVLPGSHSKLITTDAIGRIASFTTELTGELMNAITKSTILKQNIDFSENIEPDNEYLELGYQYTREHGLNAALFKVRILDNILKCNKPQIHGFFKGSVLYSELENIKNSSAKKIIIAGKSQLRNPMCYLLSQFCEKEIVSVPDEISDNATAIGMYKIYNFKAQTI